jgi:hypothetical protein
MSRSARDSGVGKGKKSGFTNFKRKIGSNALEMVLGNLCCFDFCLDGGGLPILGDYRVLKAKPRPLGRGLGAILLRVQKAR